MAAQQTCEGLSILITDTKHVMISYQWDVQRPMIQLKNQLQAHGYKVWMDVDEMGGSTLESMAKAVENASVVLVCVSQKYKESPNCRSGDYDQNLFGSLHEGSWQEKGSLKKALISLQRGYYFSQE